MLVERHPSTLDFPKGRRVTVRSMEIFRQWLALARQADRYSPNGTRRPYWLMRPLRPSKDAYRLPDRGHPAAVSGE